PTSNSLSSTGGSERLIVAFLMRLYGQVTVPVPSGALISGPPALKLAGGRRPGTSRPALWELLRRSSVRGRSVSLLRPSTTAARPCRSSSQLHISQRRINDNLVIAFTRSSTGQMLLMMASLTHAPFDHDYVSGPDPWRLPACNGRGFQ